MMFLLLFGSVYEVGIAIHPVMFSTHQYCGLYSALFILYFAYGVFVYSLSGSRGTVLVDIYQVHINGIAHSYVTCILILFIYLSDGSTESREELLDSPDNE